MPELDARWMAEFRAGDTAAYGRLWARHRGLAYAVARRTDPIGDAQDAVSDAFASVLSAMRSGRGPERSFRAYLATAVRHAALRHAKARVVLFTTPLEEDATIADPSHMDPTYQLAIEETLTQMPDRWRIAIQMVGVDGHDLNALAARFGISYGAAAILLMRARNRFRELWHETDA